jgi:hypothetical protein
MARRKQPYLVIKRGDDFNLELTVSDVNNEAAVTAQTQLDLELAKENPDIVAVQTYLDAYNAATLVDISLWAIECHLRWCGRHLYTFNTTITDGPNGLFTVSAPRADTELWTPRKAEADLQFTINGVRISSETFNVLIEKDQTFNG